MFSFSIDGAATAACISAARRRIPSGIRPVLSYGVLVRSSHTRVRRNPIPVDFIIQRAPSAIKKYKLISATRDIRCARCCCCVYVFPFLFSFSIASRHRSLFVCPFTVDARTPYLAASPLLYTSIFCV